MTKKRTHTKGSSHLPKKIWWMGGIFVACLYVCVFYYFFVGPTGLRWHAMYGDVKYPKIEGFEIQGIDISHYQGKIDWEMLRNAMIQKGPVRFVIIKATEGSNIVDENFRDNFFNSRDYGFIRGAYHFYSLKSPAKQQAEFFISHVKLEPGDLPPVLDVEHKPESESTAQFQQNVLTWLNIAEEYYGVKPILYTNYKFKQQYLSDKRFDEYPYWIAHYYVEEMQYQGAWKFWQYTDVGKLPGINGYVDFDIYNGSYYDLKQLTIKAKDNDEDEESL